MITKMTIVMLTKVKTLGKMADERTLRANRTVELTLMLYINYDQNESADSH